MDDAAFALWGNFFVAQAGAAAALAGLIFVAVSINLARVLAFPQLPGRAAEALIVVLSVLVVATCALVPGQGNRALGLEVAVAGLGVCAASTRIQVRARGPRHPDDRLSRRVMLAQMPAVPFVVGGALLAMGSAKGLYWLPVGAILSLAGGVFNAWVLLVEIQR
jgi:hypothetical protein